MKNNNIILHLCDVTEQPPEKIFKDLKFLSKVIEFIQIQNPVSVKVKDKLFPNGEPSTKEFIVTICKLEPEELHKLIRAAEEEKEQDSKPSQKTDRFMNNLKNTGIMEINSAERTIDNIGRVILPVIHRKALNLNSGDLVTIKLKDNSILITKA